MRGTLTAPAPPTAPGPGRVVVAAAIIRDGLLLAAQRAAPADLVGRWELPGGKVEPGETQVDAVVRECREELGVTVHATAELARVGLAPGLELALHPARLVTGDPRCGPDHLALRWVRADEFDALDWLPADRALLPALRDLLRPG